MTCGWFGSHAWTNTASTLQVIRCVRCGQRWGRGIAA